MFISDSIKKGWEITKKNFFFFLGILIVYFILIVAVAFVINLKPLQKIQFVGQVVYIIFSYWLGIGLVIIFLKKAKGQDTTFGDLFSGGKYLLSFIGASLLYYLIVLAGMILLIFPAIIWGIKYMFFPYLIIDKNMKAIESLKASAKITQGNKWDILGFSIVAAVVSYLGVLGLVIGLFWSMPTAMIAYILVYFKLAEKLK
ncbi:MAG: hypothetical protein JW827_07835 [Spirochaetes bacterium]|nr:hypothetical protein [Spirochaetota bacterium]